VTQAAPIAAPERGRPLRAAPPGQPNTGKTTLFNAWTGSRAHVGNYPGVTVERREGLHVCADGAVWQVLDLPGTYSLTAHSPEEELSWQALTGKLPGTALDAVVVVLDAGNLSRNLFLLLQVAALRVPVVAALNLMDEAAAAGVTVDAAVLEAELGLAVVPTVARSGQGLDALELAVAKAVRAGAPDWTPVWSDAVVAALHKAQAALPAGATLADADWFVCADPDALPEPRAQRRWRYKQLWRTPLCPSSCRASATHESTPWWPKRCSVSPVVARAPSGLTTCCCTRSGAWRCSCWP